MLEYMQAFWSFQTKRVTQFLTVICFIALSTHSFGQGCDEGQENVISSNTDIMAPTETDAQGELTALAQKGNYLFCGYWNHSAVVRVFNVSDPSNPLLVNTQGFGNNSDSTVTGANMYDMDIKDNLLFFVCRGSEKLYIVDISDPLNMVPVATTPSLFNIPTDLIVEGNYAYVCSNGGYITVFDISSPSSPTVVTTTTNIFPFTNYMVKDGNYLYLSFDNSTSAYGWYVVDVSNPTSPSLIHTESLFGISGISITGNALHAGYDDGGTFTLRTYDISNPATPVQTNEFVAAGRITEIDNDGKYLYLATDKAGDCGSGVITVMDITTPTVPTLLAESPGACDRARDMLVGLGKVYVAEEVSREIVTFPLNRTYGIDTIDQVVNACDSYTWTEGDGMIYTSSNNTATEYFSVTNGCDSVLALDLALGYHNASTQTVSAHVEYDWIDGKTYTADTNSATYTITNSTGCDSVITLNLTILPPDCDAGQENVIESNTDIMAPTAIDAQGQVSALSQKGNYLFCGYWNHSAVVRVFDVSNPSSPVLVNTQGFGDNSDSTVTGANMYDMDIKDNLLFFVCRGSEKMYIVDISDPLNMLPVATTTNLFNIPTDLIVDGDYAYVCSNGGFITVFDITNPSSPTVVTTTTNIYPFTNYMVKEGNYLYLSFDNSTSAYGWYVVDVSNPASPTLVHTETLFGCSGIYVTGNALHAGYDDGGTFTLRTYDISNPASPTQTNEYVAAGRIKEIRSDGKYLYLTTDKAGDCTSGVVTVMDVTTPTVPTLLAESPGACYRARDMLVSLGEVYLAEEVGFDIATFLLNRSTNTDSTTQVVDTCDSYQWVDGFTYTATTDTAIELLVSSGGCDSVVSLDLTINYSTSASDVVNVVGEHTWIDGNTYSADTMGVTHIIANAAGCDSVITLSLTITQDPQTITFPLLNDVPFGSPAFSPGVTASSGLPVSYTSSDLSVATIINDSIVVIGVGTTTITATQGGNNFYEAAADQTQTLTVTKADQSIDFNPTTNVPFGSDPFDFLATATSGLPVFFSSSNPAIISVTGNQATVNASGSVDITVSQGGNASYNAAPDVTITITVASQVQTITFNFPTDKVYADADFDLISTASSGLSITSYTSLNTDVVTVSGNTVTINGAGSVDIVVHQAGDGTYTSVSDTAILVIGKADQTITWVQQTIFDADHEFVELIAVASSGLPCTYQSDNLAVASVIDNLATIQGSGKVLLSAFQDGDDNYNPASQVDLEFSMVDVEFAAVPGALSLPINHTWDIVVEGLLPTDYSSIEIQELPFGLEFIGNQLVATDLFSRDYPLNVVFLDELNDPIFEKEWILELPEVDFAGIKDKMYVGGAYQFEFIADHEIDVVHWEYDGQMMSGSENVTSVNIPSLTSGPHQITVYFNYVGVLYEYERQFETIEVNIDLGEPIAFINAPAIYSLDNTQLASSYGISPQNITWSIYEGGAMLSQVAFGNEASIDFKVAGSDTVVVEFDDEFGQSFRFSQEVNVLPALTFNLPDTIFIDFQTSLDFQVQFLNENEFASANLNDLTVQVRGIDNYSSPRPLPSLSEGFPIYSDYYEPGLFEGEIEVFEGGVSLGKRSFSVAVKPDVRIVTLKAVSNPNPWGQSSGELQEQGLEGVVGYKTQFKLNFGNDYFLQPESVRWTFTPQGGGTALTANQVSPRVRFTQPGSYQIKVDVQFANGLAFSHMEPGLQISPNFDLIVKMIQPSTNHVPGETVVFGWELTTNVGFKSTTPKFLVYPKDIAWYDESKNLVQIKSLQSGIYPVSMEIVGITHDNDTVIAPASDTLRVGVQNFTQTIKVASKNGDPIVGAKVTVQEILTFGLSGTTSERKRFIGTFFTNDQGEIVNFGNNFITVSNVPKYVFSIEPGQGAVPSVQEKKFASAGTTTLEIDLKIVLHDMDLVSDGAVFDPSKQEYTFTNLVINDKISFPGITTVNVTEGKPAVLTTSGNVVLLTPSRSLNTKTAAKSYSLYKGMIIASKKDQSWFDMGTYHSVDMFGVILSFTDQKDTLEVMSYARLPWFLSAYMNQLAEAQIEKVLEMAKSSAANGLSLPPNGKVLFLQKLLEAQLSERFSGEVEIAQKIVGSTTFWDFALRELTLTTPTGFGIEELTIIDSASADYFYCKAFMSIGELEGDKATGGRAFIERVHREGEVTLPFDEFTAALPEARAEKILKKREVQLISTQQDEIIDISADVENKRITRGVPITGLGMSFGIQSGKIDEVSISAGVEIEFPSYGIKLTKITGGLKDLTKKDPVTQVVEYTPNFTIFANCDFENLAAKNSPLEGVFKGEEVGINIKLFNSITGQAKFKLFEVPIGEGKFLAQLSPPLMKATVTTNLLSGFIKGGFGMSMGYDQSNEFDIVGSGNVTVSAPDIQEVPKVFRKQKLGSALAGFNKEVVATKIKFSLAGESSDANSLASKVYREDSCTLKDLVNGILPSAIDAMCFWCEKDPPSGDDCTDIKNRTKRHSAFLSNPGKVIGDFLIENQAKILELMNFETGISFKWETGEFSFGDVEVPQVRRRVTRGDTVQYAFDVSIDSRSAYVFIEHAGGGVIPLTVKNPDGSNLTALVPQLFVPEKNTSILHVALPEPGTWSVEIDTTGLGPISVLPWVMDNAPSVGFNAPTQIDTAQTQLNMSFNDTDDTLDVRIFVDNDRAGFDGREIANFRVLNNANIKFDYEGLDLAPGTYYFHYVVSDHSRVPEMGYSQGGLYVEGGQLPDPMDLQVDINRDTALVSWSAFNKDVVDFIHVEVTNSITGESTFLEMAEDTVLVFAGLKVGHPYSVVAYNATHEGTYSAAITVGNVLGLPGSGNNAPVFNYGNYAVLSFQEGQFNSYALLATDPDGDSLSYDILENLPKTMLLARDSIYWIPEVGDAGLYDFHVVVSDGELTDTALVSFEVRTAGYQAFDISFGSAQLHESDNMFVFVQDDVTEDDSIMVVIRNPRTDEDALLVTRRTSDNEFSGKFDLSVSGSSLVDVQDGDTIVAVFIGRDGFMYVNMAMFNETPQIADHVSPDGITDLEVLDDGSEYLQLVFTVPVDRLDNGMEHGPWIYDLRYSFSSLNTEEEFGQGEFINFYDIGLPGEKDTLIVLKELVNGLEDHAQVYFNIKSGDSRFNYSPMSNTVLLQHVIQIENLEATLSNGYVANLSWEGPEDTISDFFNYYQIYRGQTLDDMVVIDRTYSNSYSDTLIFVTNVGLFYAVDAVYENEVSDQIISNYLQTELFSDVTIRVINSEDDNLQKVDSLRVLIKDENGDIQAEGITGPFGSTLFQAFNNGVFTVEVSDEELNLVNESIEITPDSNNFEFALDHTNHVVEHIDNSPYELFPNPSEGIINIISGKGAWTISEVKMYNAQGLLIGEWPIEDHEKSLKIDLTGYDKGLYQLSIQTAHGLIYENIVFQ